MKLKKMIIQNFRQFYGRQEIDLETDSNKNIIVIHGENGSGKTTLLEGFSWCLYGELGLIQHNDILNEKVFFDLGDNQKGEARISLLFEDRTNEYVASRYVSIKNIGNKQYHTKEDQKFELMINGKVSHNPKDTIEQILSKNLKRYFFFDGERIDKLAKPESSKEIETAIKNVMGIAIYENGMKHLDDAKKDLLKDLKKKEPSDQTSPFEEEDKIKTDLEEIVVRIENLERGKQAKISERTIITEKLQKVEALEILERERLNLENQQLKLKNDLSKLIEKEHKLIAEEAYLAITQDAILHVQTFLESKRKLGELPAGIREQFIQDLIKKGECICGTQIKNNDKHYLHLQKLLKSTVKKNVEDGFIRISGFAGQHLDIKEKFTEKLQGSFESKQDVISSMKEVEEKLREKNFEINKNAPDSSSAELIIKREDIEKTINDMTEKIGSYKGERERLSKAYDEIQSRIEKHHAKNRQIDIAEKRVDLCQKTLDKMKDNYDSLKHKVRSKLSDKVSAVFKSIVGSYDAKINSKFELVITKEINGNEVTVGTSTGENQIASLSFIGSMVNIAKEWDEKGDGDILTGAGIYPIIMDSPFGALDSEYRDMISANLQQLAPQVITFVSSSQWSQEVEKNLRPYLKHEYILEYHNTIEENSEYKTMEIDGKIFPMVVADDFEFTQIKKVK